MAQDTLALRVRALTHEAETVLGIELRPQDEGALLPAFEAGAHVDVHLPQGGVRSYSLCNAPGERHRWCLGVHRDPASRGGSRWLHEQLRPGDVLQVGLPRNRFALAEHAPAHVFVAGGIGITPVLAMLARTQALGTPWTLHYAARTRRHAAFLERLAQHAASSGARLHLHFDDEHGGRPLDIHAIVRSLPDDAHIYCCGPAPMLAAYAQATAHLQPARVHQEAFAAAAAPAGATGYRVELARSGKSLQVPPGQALLDALIAAGADPLYSCRQGVCGTCAVGVLEGVPDHRDFVLTPEERQANDRILPCCSGALSERLVLDL